MGRDGENTYDVVVVGTGAAGLTAAVTASLRGLSVLVVEKAQYFGGSTAFSGGIVWIPNNFYLQHLDLGMYLPKVGLADTPEKARAYLDGLVGPTVSGERLDAFLQDGPEMIRELHDAIGLSWVHWPVPDYFSERPGGMSFGRSIEPAVFDGAKLGGELAHLRPQSPAWSIKGFTPTAREGISMASGGIDPKAAVSILRVLVRAASALVMRRKPLANGQALIAHLRYALMQRDVPVWLSCPLESLVTEGEGAAQRVTGVRVTRNGQPLTIRARRGVVVATGGFARSQTMREKYLPAPTNADWSLVPEEGQHGDGIVAAEAIGAGLGLTDKAWGFPTVILPLRNGKMTPMMALFERMKPGVIVVNGRGQRYFDEGMPYEDGWKTMYAENSETSPTIPSWMIFDSRAKRHYTFFQVPLGVPFPRRWTKKGGPIQRAESLGQLAAKIGVPAETLEATVNRHNELARRGHDDDFGKGDTAFGRFFGDGLSNSPNLHPIEHGPYYAVPIWPGDIGTKGGIVIDKDGQALRSDGTVIPGLFACGNATASVMGDTYPGGGGTIAPAMVLGYSAANRLAELAELALESKQAAESAAANSG